MTAGVRRDVNTGRIAAPRRMRLVRLDLVSGRTGWRRRGAELLAALVALALVALLRGFIDIWLPNTAPYALA